MKAKFFNPAVLFLLVVTLFANSFAVNLFTEMFLGFGGSSYKEEFQGYYKPDGNYVKGKYAYFRGLGPSAELKIGGSTEYYAIFASAGFMQGFGRHDLVRNSLPFTQCPDGGWFSVCYDYMEANDMENSSGHRFYAGIGGIYYPFATLSDMPNGLYIGTTVTIMGMRTEAPSYELASGNFFEDDGINRDGIGLELEVGHLWPVTKSWNLGVAMIYTRDFPFERGDDAKFSFNTLWLGATLVKK